MKKNTKWGEMAIVVLAATFLISALMFPGAIFAGTDQYSDEPLDTELALWPSTVFDSFIRITPLDEWLKKKFPNPQPIYGPPGTNC